MQPSCSTLPQSASQDRKRRRSPDASWPPVPLSSQSAPFTPAPPCSRAPNGSFSAAGTGRHRTMASLILLDHEAHPQPSARARARALYPWPPIHHLPAPSPDRCPSRALSIDSARLVSLSVSLDTRRISPHEGSTPPRRPAALRIALRTWLSAPKMQRGPYRTQLSAWREMAIAAGVMRTAAGVETAPSTPTKLRGPQPHDAGSSP